MLNMIQALRATIALTIGRLVPTERFHLRLSSRGQTASEYLGIMVLVAAIIVAIFAIRIGDETIAGAIAGGIGDAVEDIVGAGSED